VAESDVVVITGAGGMGLACARRLGTGRHLVLADVSQRSLDAAQDRFAADGFDVHTRVVDVADADSVAALAEACADLGTLRTLVHTAGLSPTMADADRILAVDLLGTALVIEAFEEIAGPGCVAVIIASMSGVLMPVDPEVELRLATAAPADLPADASVAGLTSPGVAYAFAKRGNQLRVRAAAPRWGRRGARIVSISPGIIATGMGHQELGGQEGGAFMRQMVAATPMERLGTAEDIAAAADWLASPAASFVSGIDLLVDGGVVAAVHHPLG
jgi:NAD(P)-dependent dehydrogenase (short-subunit alcohol dehydrogenase family)